MLQYYQNKSLFMEMTKAVDLLTEAYQQDILYDFEVLRNNKKITKWLYCVGRLGTHIAPIKNEINLLANVVYPVVPEIFKDDNFSGSSLLTGLIMVSHWAGGDVEKSFPVGVLYWLNHDYVETLISSGNSQALEDQINCINRRRKENGEKEIV